jgi:hypothetical protein
MAITVVDETTEGPMSLAKASLVAGVGLLVMVLTVPFAEFYIFSRLTGQDSLETANNILNNDNLFKTGILLHFITQICDVIVAWALYILLKPVNKDFSLLTAWFRLVYTAVYLIALTNLIKVINLVKDGRPSINAEQIELGNAVEFYMNSFQLEWEFGLLIFGVYLCLLGYLVYQADYIPKIYGILLWVAGFGYIVNTISHWLFPELNTGFLVITFFGEVIFMFWLLIKGTKLKAVAPLAQQQRK